MRELCRRVADDYHTRAGQPFLYVGSAASYSDLLGGSVLAEIDVLPTSLPHVNAGKLRALATASGKRLSQLPNVPTIAEAGVPGYEFDAWYGFVTTGGTPKAVVDKLHDDIVKALHAADVKERLTGAGKDNTSWSSMVLAGDRLYVVNHSGDTFVLRANPKFELLATNSLGERTEASIAASDGELFIRTHQALWRIGTPR